MTEKMENISRSALYRESGPSLEDQYRDRGYTYNAERNVWEAPLVPAAPPAKSVNGDMWIDTSTGAQYVYYTSETKSQWVQVGGSSIGA